MKFKHLTLEEHEKIAALCLVINKNYADNLDSMRVAGVAVSDLLKFVDELIEKDKTMR
jgi:hypothetical protein